MLDVVIDVREAGAVELLLDRHAMALWELLRRAGTPVTIAQLSRRSGSSQSMVQQAMDAIVAFGLVKRMPAAGRRKTITYQATCERIVVRGDLADPQDAPLFKRYYERFSAYNEGVLGRDGFVDHAAQPGALIQYYAAPLDLSDTEAAELRRRTQEVLGFLKMLQDKHVGPRARPTTACNHYACFRIQPLAEPQLPQPEIVIRPRNQTPSDGVASSKGPWKRLSPREREIALALASGSTQPEIAHRIGVSPHTVATFAKRIHAKLGIRRRAELVNVLRGVHIGDDMGDHG
jgi:DNA-binding CsgD family transcriptional regulator